MLLTTAAHAWSGTVTAIGEPMHNTSRLARCVIAVSLCLGSLLVWPGCAVPMETDTVSGVSEDLATRTPYQQQYDSLHRGVSVVRWFYSCLQDGTTNVYTKRCSTAYVAGYITQADVDQWKAMHLTFVRIFVDPTYFFSVSSNPVGAPVQTTGISVDDFKAALSLVTRNGISVVLAPDYFNPSGSTLKDVFRTHAKNDPQTVNFINYHQAALNQLAAIAYSVNPSMISIDTLNEPPVFYATPITPYATKTTPADWYQLQGALIAGVRAYVGHPQPTLIANGGAWENAAYLNGTYATFDPYAQPNVMYSVHIYDPSILSGQGLAKPGWIETALIQHLPYPIAKQTGSSSCQSPGNLQQYLAIDSSGAMLPAAMANIKAYLAYSGCTNAIGTCHELVATLARCNFQNVPSGTATDLSPEQASDLVACALNDVVGYVNGPGNGVCYNSDFFSNAQHTGIADSVAHWRNTHVIDSSVPPESGGGGHPVVLVEEFGAVKTAADPTSFVNFITDEVSAYEALGLHWNMNEYVSPYNGSVDPSKPSNVPSPSTADGYAWGLMSEEHPAANVCNRVIDVPLGNALGLNLTTVETSVACTLTP